ncbi:MAG TPA: HAMP domain-containing histidine kinase, partial [Firmicutes bacterium]|nr:HAMP domain-containing histidine kinase [Bacillota bacterium]
AAMAVVDAGTMALYLEATGGRLPSASVCSPFSLKGKRLGVFTVEEFSQRKTQAFAAAAPAFLQVAADLIALGTGCFHRETEESTVSERERDRMRSELIAVLSHEMRTPLASIKGYVTALLRDDVEWDAGTRREFLEIIDRETDTLTQVITEILDASMLEEGGLELNKEPLLLPRLVEKVVNEVCPRAPQHRFLVCFPPDFPIVAGDRLRIEQVLRNLLDNAVKYSDGGLIVLRGEARGDEVVVSVADQGVGIKPDHLNRLFERFYRIKNEGRRAVVGTGLGLPIARDIVEKHGGRIWASSQVGKGTTFFFTLPCDSSAHLPGTT